MKKEALSYYANPELVMLTLFLFFLLFVGVVLWTYRKSGKNYYDEIARLPLKEPNPNGGHHE
ncbi:MAG: CcoQ/FixQ family Cbb3-type cytochrome c oxidase assembly chaperone [Bdellovibrionales bacterium]|nr:CcoQ/FixQ family Cbb3-type cytochrome c oxidase assembly chaperone [Bdellovibrionales bacterium]